LPDAPPPAPSIKPPEAPPADGARFSSLPRVEERTPFDRSKALLTQAANSAANGFLDLLHNQTTPAEVLRQALEDIIEYRAAATVLSRVAEKAVLRATEATVKASNYDRISNFLQ
ncbi:MAG: hypothetical protein ACREFQ_11285, partial [Stellaceae bacterium]